MKSKNEEKREEKAVDAYWQKCKDWCSKCGKFAYKSTDLKVSKLKKKTDEREEFWEKMNIKSGSFNKNCFLCGKKGHRIGTSCK